MIIDAHAHIGSFKFENKDWGIDYNKLLRLMKNYEISKTCILPVAEQNLFKKPRVRDRDVNNSKILTYAKKYPKKFIPIFWANPYKPNDCKVALENGFKAIKIHSDLHLLSINDKKIITIADICGQYGVPLFIHTDEKDVLTRLYKLADLAKRFQEVNFIALHSGGTLSTFFNFLRYGLNELDNVFFDTSGIQYFKILERIYIERGAKFIIFGSDLPFGHPKIGIEMIKLLTKNKKERKLMLGKNIQRLLKL